MRACFDKVPPAGSILLKRGKPYLRLSTAVHYTTPKNLNVFLYLIWHTLAEPRRIALTGIDTPQIHFEGDPPRATPENPHGTLTGLRPYQIEPYDVLTPETLHVPRQDLHVGRPFVAASRLTLTLTGLRQQFGTWGPRDYATFVCPFGHPWHALLPGKAVQARQVRYHSGPAPEPSNEIPLPPAPSSC